MLDDPYGSAENAFNAINLAWEVPVKATIKGVTYKIYTAKAKHTFWQHWKENKNVLKEYGFEVRAERDKYFITFAIEAHKIEDLGVAKTSANVLPGPYELHEDMFKLLKKHQIPAAGSLVKILKVEDFALDASEMGLGKTFHALATVKTLGINYAVICPASGITKWKKTALDFFGLEAEFVLSYQKMVRGNTPYLDKAVLKGRRRRGKPGKDKRSWKWNTVDDVLIIWDEIQYCGGQDSQNSEMLEEALKNKYIKNIGLSATAADSPLGLKVLGRALGLHKGYNFWTWCFDHGCKEAHFGGLEFTQDKSRQQHFQTKLHNEIYPTKGIRLKKSELEAQLPDNILLAECIDIDFNPGAGFLKEALKHIDTLEEEDAEKEEVSHLTARTRNRQRAELLKIPYLVEEANAAMQQGMSVVIFTNYKLTVEVLKGQFKAHKPSIIVGGQTAKVRDLALENFQTNKIQLAIVNIEAGSELIDLHDIDGNFPRYVLLCPMDKAKKMVQCLGRVDRVGKMSISTQKMVFARQTKEEDVYDNVCNKMDNIHLLNDGDLENAERFNLQN